MKKFLAAFLLITVALPSLALAQDEAEKPVEIDPIEQLEELLKDDPHNPILNAELKMRRFKDGKIKKVDSDDSWRWRGSQYITALRRDLYGGFTVTNEQDFDHGLSLLTGETAIDESLQLGSIGSDRGNDPFQGLLGDVRINIENYKDQNGEYPNSLADFEGSLGHTEVWWNGDLHNIADIADMFEYSLIGIQGEITGFELKIRNRDKSFPLSDITPVEIRSHPWAEMLGETKIESPSIARLVPKDTSALFVQTPPKLLELEKVILELVDTFETDLYTFGKMAELRPDLLKRLGVPDEELFIQGLKEFVFISEDFDFFPSTDYAMILGFKNETFKSGFNLLTTEKIFREDVGDYTVVTTSPQLLDKIKNTFADESIALSSQEDFHFTLSQLEGRRDGFVYLSEAFIRKLTGPRYRINARRRNTIISALENLQYIVFGYYRITGKWPKSVQQMADLGYIQKNAVADQEAYSIDTEGRVHHSEWGSLWNIAPINQVPITNLSFAEKNLYDRFADEYQNYFREFFDPIGIAFTVSDQVLFHTIILPLIDQSEYNFIKDVFGQDKKRFALLFEPIRSGAVNIAASFSIDDILLAAAADQMRGDEAVPEEMTEEQRRAAIRGQEEEMAKELDMDLPKDKRLLDFVGDEVAFGIGEENRFTVSNIADIDVWFALKLNDTGRAEAFMKKLYQLIRKEMGGAGDFGIFSLSSVEPLQNEYEGQKYFLIPTGFVNAYYMFLNDTFYFTFSQLSINRFIDAYKNGADQGMSEALQRGYAFTGDTHHIAAGVDFEKVAQWSSEELESEFGTMSKWEIEDAFQARKNYLFEAWTLSQMLDNHDESLENVSGYYSFLPESFLGGTFIVTPKGIFFEGQGQQVRLTDIETGPQFSDEKEEQTTAITDLVAESFSVDDFKERVAAFKDGSLGVSFTPEGLEVRIAFANVFHDGEIDSRFVSPMGGLIPNTSTSRKMMIVFGVLIFVLIGGGFGMRMMRH